VTLDSAGADVDHLIYHGTALNDVFNVSSSGVVTLNAQLPLSTPGISTATLQGFAGDDSFTLAPAISASPFAVLDFNGGESSAGDKAFFIGTAGNDDFGVSGTSITSSGKTVNANGVEDEFLNALGGTDSFHYVGIVGVNETINLAATTTAAAGRLFVPGRMSLTFTGGELFDVTGNIGDTDTFTFTATNSPDVIEIHTDAAGTPASPVLKLSNLAAQTLLTLTNYLNIETLRLNALDGEDVISVFTGPTAGRSILIDSGPPTAKKKSTDSLTVYYASPRPKIIQSTATQNPGSGLVDLIYPTARTLVQYVDTEVVVVKKL
jgi:hypothetical protein